jgi:hypothetical protein
MSKDYYVTPYEDGCAVERDGEGIISVHHTEAEAVREACELSDRNGGGDVLVRSPQAGRCRGQTGRKSRR